MAHLAPPSNSANSFASNSLERKTKHFITTEDAQKDTRPHCIFAQDVVDSVLADAAEVMSSSLREHNPLLSKLLSAERLYFYGCRLYK